MQKEKFMQEAIMLSLKGSAGGKGGHLVLWLSKMEKLWVEDLTK
jgi:hypothetical protein